VYGEGKGAMASLASAGEQELETYRQVVRMATMENVLTSSKLKMLADMRQQLHISEQQHHKVLKDLYIGKDEWLEMKDKGLIFCPSFFIFVCPPCFVVSLLLLPLFSPSFGSFVSNFQKRPG